jgi:glucosyl-3-phosphoglycerate phosphatase
VRRLVLVRHGESVWNSEARIQGQACAGLSDVGHAQAQAVCAMLAVAHPDARLVVSDLQRCRETIAPLSAELGRDPDVDPALRERFYGDWEGRLRSEIAETEADRWRRFGEGEDVLPEVGGETTPGFADRVEETLSALLSDTPEGETTVAVTHGGPIWHGTHRVLGLQPPSLAGVDNTSVTEVVRTGDGRVLLDRWNEVGHLGPELRTTMGRRATGAASVRSMSSRT